MQVEKNQRAAAAGDPGNHLYPVLKEQEILHTVILQNRLVDGKGDLLVIDEVNRGSFLFHNSSGCSVYFSGEYSARRGITLHLDPQPPEAVYEEFLKYVLP